jgi:hypothetical protein
VHAHALPFREPSRRPSKSAENGLCTRLRDSSRHERSSSLPPIRVTYAERLGPARARELHMADDGSPGLKFQTGRNDACR